VTRPTYSSAQINDAERGKLGSLSGPLGFTSCDQSFFRKLLLLREASRLNILLASPHLVF